MAIDKCKSVLRYVQTAVRESEDRSRTKEINDLLDRSYLTHAQNVLVRDLHLSGQKLIHEGPMQLRTRENSIDLRVVLMTNMLLLLQEKEGRLLPKVTFANVHS